MNGTSVVPEDSGKGINVFCSRRGGFTPEERAALNAQRQRAMQSKAAALPAGSAARGAADAAAANDPSRSRSTVASQLHYDSHERAGKPWFRFQPDADS